MVDVCRRVWIVGLLALCVLAAPGAARAYEPQPLPSKGPESRTIEVLLEKKADWDKRTMLMAYRTAGTRNDIWDSAAWTYLSGTVALYANDPKAPSYGTLMAQGNALIDLGCTDPLILYCHARTLMGFGDLTRPEPLLKQAVDGLVASRYPTFRAYFAAQRYATLLGNQGKQEERAAARTQADALLEKLLLEDQGALKDQWVLYFHLRDGIKGMPLARLEAIAVKLEAQKTPTNRWLTPMVLGETALRQALAIRQADRVVRLATADANAFAAAIERARTHFVEAQSVFAESPDPAIGMLACSRVAGPERGTPIRRWFDAAVSAQFDALEAYDQYQATLMPDNGGRPEAAMAFGQECLQTGRFDTLVPYRYIEILLALAADPRGRGYETWTGLPDVWPSVRTVLDGYAREPRFREDAAWYSSLAIAFAWRLGQYREACDRLQQLGDRLIPAAFSQLGGSMAEAYAEILARGGGQATAVARAEALYDSGRLADARASYGGLRDAGASAPVLGWVRRRLATIAWEQNFRGGGWVNLDWNDHLDGWTWYTGNWQPTLDGKSVTVSGDPRPRLVCAANFGSRVELEVDVELAPDFEATAAVAPGVSLAVTRSAGPDRDLRVLLDAAPYLHLRVDGTRQEPIRVPVPALKSGRLRVLLWDDTLSAWLDDVPLLTQRRVGVATANRQKQIGLVAELADPDRTVIFRNLRVRLPAGVPTDGVSLRRDLDACIIGANNGRLLQVREDLLKLAKQRRLDDDEATAVRFTANTLKAAGELDPNADIQLLERFPALTPEQWTPVGDAKWTLADGTLSVETGRSASYLMAAMTGSKLRCSATFELPTETPVEVGLVLGWLPGESPVTVTLEPDRRTWAIGESMVAGRIASFAAPPSAAAALPPSTVQIIVLLNGNQVDVQVDGEVILSRILERPIQGHLGLCVLSEKPGVKVQVRNFNVGPLPASAATTNR